MPTRDPVKNREYVKKSQQKLKNAIGIDEFNKRHASTQQKSRNKSKEAKGIDVYRKEQAEYMKAYRARKKNKIEKPVKSSFYYV